MGWVGGANLERYHARPRAGWLAVAVVSFGELAVRLSLAFVSALVVGWVGGGGCRFRHCLGPFVRDSRRASVGFHHLCAVCVSQPPASPSSANVVPSEEAP